MKWLRKEKARLCPIHQAVLEATLDELHSHGYFHKQEVLEQLSFEAVAEAIRWDYISEFIRDDLSEEIVPLAQAFWTGTKADKAAKRKITPELRKKNPGAYLAMGHGKRTAGYALVSVDDHRLAVKHLAFKRSLANGVGTSFRDFATELQKRNAIHGSDLRLIDSMTK